VLLFCTLLCRVLEERVAVARLRVRCHPATPPRQAFVDRFRFNAKRAALVQSRIKAIERLADVETIADDPGAGALCCAAAGCTRSCVTRVSGSCSQQLTHLASRA